MLGGWPFLTIAIKRVVSEVFTHVGVIIQRSKGKNYSSAGATILPQSESGFVSVAPGHRDIHEDDVRCPLGSDRDGFQASKSDPAFHAFERQMSRQCFRRIVIVVDHQPVAVCDQRRSCAQSMDQELFF